MEVTTKFNPTIVISLTLDEAKAAVDDPIDLKMAIESHILTVTAQESADVRL